MVGYRMVSGFVSQAQKEQVTEGYMLQKGLKILEMHYSDIPAKMYYKASAMLGWSFGERPTV